MKIQKLSLSPFHWNEIIEVVVEYYKMRKKKNQPVMLQTSECTTSHEQHKTATTKLVL